MTLWHLFVAIFVGGPLLFFTGLWVSSTPTGTGWMLAATLCLVILGMGFHYAAGPDWGRNMDLTLPGLAAIWASWIALLVFCVQRARAAWPGKRMRRLSGAIGAMGTTVPWFGLSWAQAFSG